MSNMHSATDRAHATTDYRTDVHPTGRVSTETKSSYNEANCGVGTLN